MDKAPVYIVDIIGEVVAAVNTAIAASLSAAQSEVLDRDVIIEVNYTYGRSIQILKKLQDLNNSNTKKNTQYPLIALFQDFPEERGKNDFYASVRFPKIVIAALTKSTDDPPARYQKVFKPLLYPIYYEFLRQLTRHKDIIIGKDINTIPHIKWDRPGSQPEGQNLNDYLDAIELQDLTLSFKQNCK